MITVKLYTACSSSSMPILSDMFFNTPIVPDTSSSCSSCCSAINWGKHKKQAMFNYAYHKQLLIVCLIDQVLQYLLLNLLLLYELRVGILQLAVQPAIFIRNGLPDVTMSRLTKQSLSSTIQKDTERHMFICSLMSNSQTPRPSRELSLVHEFCEVVSRIPEIFQNVHTVFWQLSGSLKTFVEWSEWTVITLNVSYYILKIISYENHQC